MKERKIWWVILPLFAAAGIWVGGKYSSSRDFYSILLETQDQIIELKVTPRTEKVITLEGPLGETIVKIEGGKVWVSSSPCPDHICIEMGKIPDNGGFIACIPNRIIIRKR
ncbi:NusG domain II-containing protein [Candidatus Sordicultor fermentans]|uniref:NusG domain II-containing protein n=1 Tax=Candidatus Sordicultor fermentans TaxID=1953203 RepID=UPI0016B7AA5C|nr:hypothetical protein [Candidatus Atribacteria bacterium]